MGVVRKADLFDADTFRAHSAFLRIGKIQAFDTPAPVVSGSKSLSPWRGFTNGITLIRLPDLEFFKHDGKILYGLTYLVYVFLLHDPDVARAFGGEQRAVEDFRRAR